jgi:hypothetical protein
MMYLVYHAKGNMELLRRRYIHSMCDRWLRNGLLMRVCLLGLGISFVGANPSEQRTVPTLDGRVGVNPSEQRYAPALDDRIPTICAEIYRVRQIGLSKDVAQAPFLIGILQEAIAKEEKALEVFRPVRGMPWGAPYNTHLWAATLVALGRLGVPDSIPTLEAFGSHPYYSHLEPFVRVALARVKAESATPSPKTYQKWRQRIERFLDELGMSLSELAHRSQELDNRLLSRRPPSLERLALRALAEMAAEAYSRGHRDVFHWLDRAGIAWNSDPAAWLCVRLVNLSAEQRVEWLMSQLRTKSVLRPEDAYLCQALSDLGEIAVDPLQKWLDELWQERSSESRQSPYTRTDRLLTECVALLSATGTANGRSILVQQYSRCQADLYLQSNLALILDQSPWTFTSDW